MRGGKRSRAGRKKGSSGIPKTRLKADSQKRTVRKLYQWTPDEYERITQAVQKAQAIESKFVQSAVLEKVENVMADGEQRVAADEKPPA